MIAWFILLMPLLSALFILLVSRNHRQISAMVSIGAVAISFLLSVILFGSSTESAPSLTWLSIGDSLRFEFGLLIDSLSKPMLLLVTGVGLLVHVYSLGYMKEDAGKARYFMGLSFFVFSMLGIVLSDNFVMMFIFWELVGVSSYILIGHWFTRPSAAEASKKAFVVNRIGDFGFMLGILMVWASTGTVFFLDTTDAGQAALLLNLTAHPGFLTAAVLLVFCGAIGKSAQIPLHVWLPDAMEGPTPVSALIHAATMVAAGVYMLARVFYLVEMAPIAADVIAWIGGVTAFMAALMATQQHDIKRVLAYSTLSQLGYMIAAIGVLSAGAAMFHLFTHGFFKALLFLGAGAVIHEMRNEQNIWKMGALKNHMPITFFTFLAGGLALMGCIGFSGYFSKDLIMGIAYEQNRVVFWLLMLGAGLTAFYVARLFLVVFLNKPRSDLAKHAHEAPKVMTVPMMILAVLAVIGGYKWFMGNFWAIPDFHPPMIVHVLAIGVFLIGTGVATVFYLKCDKDPLHILIFENRFYIDDFYAWLVERVQGGFAAFLSWFDRWVLDTGGVRGLAGAVWGGGFVLRFLQVGNLQAYAFLFGLGVVLIIYYIVFG